MEKDSVTIDSFVIRFVKHADALPRKGVNGVVTHVQSNDRLQFTDWQEVVRFINRFVEIDKSQCKPGSADEN